MRFAGFIFRPLLALLLILGCAFSVKAQTLQFAQPTIVPTGNWPAAVYTADVNGDGFPDLIYIDQGATPNQPSTTHVLLNDGKGHFHQSAQLQTAGNSIALSFFGGTGHRDIGWLTWTQSSTAGAALLGTVTLTVAPGQGDGTFGALQTTTYSTAVRQPSRFAYLSGFTFQGLGVDIVAVDTANNLIYSFTPGAGATASNDYTFTNLTEGSGPYAVANLNGSAKIAFVVNSLTNADAQIFVLNPTANSRGFGSSIGAGPTSVFHGSGEIHSLLLQDVNLDGRIDMIAQGTNGHIDVFPGNGDGTFSSTSIGGTGTLDGLSGNGGHLIGLSHLPQAQQPAVLTATPAGISSLLVQANAAFALQGIYNAGPGRTSYALADFNGDGVLDLAVDSPEGIAILYGNADGSFQTSQAFATGQPALAATVGAFTASHKLDVAVATAATQAQLLLGQGDGTLVATPAPTSAQRGPAGLWSSIATADLNGDGLLDLVQTADGANANLPANGSGIAVQLGHGDGTFEPPVSPQVADQFAKPAPSSCSPPFDHFPGLLYGTSVVADFTGDGLADIANRDSGAYRILRGNNGSAAQSYSQYPTLFFSGSDGTNTMSDCNLNAHQLVATGDLNHDARPDLIYQSNGSLLVYLTASNGSPTPIGDLAVDGSLTTPGQLTAPDLAPNFGGQSAALGFPAAIGSMLIADLDGDGNQDLLVLYANLAEDPAHPGPQATDVRNWLYVWYGSGNGKFLTSAAHPQNPVRIQPSRDFYEMAVGKLDSSGKPLLAMSDGYVVSVGTLGAEQHLLAGQGINGLAVADLRGTGQQDLVVANGGLTLSNPVANHEVLTPNPDVNGGGVTVLLNGSVTTAPTITGTLAANPEPSLAGADYTLTATLTPTAGSPVPTGSIQFSVNGVSLSGLTALVPNGNGGATASVTDSSGRLSGTYQLSAAYSGDTHFAASVIQSTHTVVLSPTVTTLNATAPLTVFYGQPIDTTFAVTGLSSNHLPMGLYSLRDNGLNVSICSDLKIGVGCVYGNAILIDAGQHLLSVHYSGDPYNAPSDSKSIAYTVLPDNTTVSLKASPSTAAQGATVTFSSAVTGNIVNPQLGTVVFSEGSVLLGNSSLDRMGNTSFSTQTLTPGDHTITATYVADLDFNAAKSASVVVHITPATSTGTPSFTMQITPGSASVITGGTVALMVSVTAQGGFNQAVQLSCANLPAEARCMFLPGLVPAGGGTVTTQTATMQIAASAASNCGDPSHPNYLAAGFASTRTLLPFLASAFLLTMACCRRRKLLKRLALSCLMGSLLLNLGGCGNCLDQGTRPGTYTVTVTGKAQGGPASQTVAQQVTLTVTLK